MTKYVYRALVTVSHTYPVRFEVDVTDGKSPWGPKAREAARDAALKAAAVAQYVGEQSRARTDVRLTMAQEKE